jgi:hypothetical protein
VDDSRNITKNCQEDVDQKIGTTATLDIVVSFARRAGGSFVSYLKEDTKRREDDGKNDLADVAGGGSASGGGNGAFNGRAMAHRCGSLTLLGKPLWSGFVQRRKLIYGQHKNLTVCD